MKYVNVLALGTLLFTGSVYAQGFNFSAGPFNMQFNLEGTYYATDHQDILDSPICFAISNRKKLDMVVEGKEIINSREIKFVTKRLVVEPYAFGITRDGKPVLRGNVISEKLIKDVSIKYGEDRFENNEWSDEKEKGFFSGWFKSAKNQDIDIQKITNLFVISNSSFEAPRDYKGIQDDTIRVICQLPVAGK